MSSDLFYRPLRHVIRRATYPYPRGGLLLCRKSAITESVWDSVNFRLSKNASQNFVHKDETKSNLFFAPACTKRKIQIGLQVWNLFAKCGQIMRAGPTCLRGVCQRPYCLALAADLLAHRISGGISVKMLRRSILTDSEKSTDCSVDFLYPCAVKVGDHVLGGRVGVLIVAVLNALFQHIPIAEICQSGRDGLL